VSETEATVPAPYRRLSIPTPFAVGNVNCWLIEDDPLTLVDTGPNWGRAFEALELALAELGHRIEDLERLVVTHQHIDHEGLLGMLARRSGAEVVALDLLARPLEDYDAWKKADDDFAAELMLRHGVPADVVTALKAVSRLAGGWGGPATVDTRLPDGGDLAFAGRTLHVLHRPGHSPTDTLFHDAAHGVLIGGDHLLGHISSNPLISLPVGGRSGEVGSYPHALLMYMRSMRETAAMDDVAIVLPGHGDPVTGAAELVESRLDGHERRARKIARMVHDHGPVSAHEIAHGLWGGVALTQAYLTLSEVLGHLDLLTERGEVAAEDGADGAVTFSPAGA
jgi:glyoxylase-like metal-dependent hydrolase (beta-lactamase superfamily II)